MSASVATARISEDKKSLFEQWTSIHSYALLALLTLLCLLPFSGRAFHIDDPLFIWSGQQITKHPLDPFGFNVLWDNYSEAMSEVTKNPPLACYYAAAIGSIAGWSERALHLGFLLAALALILGTYRLAMRFTHAPLLAAAATLFTPGIMVSAASVMCDTLMLALWIWAAILWIEGLDNEKPVYLASSSLLIGMAALTKYFGISLLPLLLVYSIARKRRLGWWVLYSLVPISLLAAYQLWTTIKYGHPMFAEALNFAESERVINGKVSPLTSALVGLSFSGGCTLSALLLSPFLWRWKKLLGGLIAGTLASAALVLGWVGLEPYAEVIVRGSLRAHPLSTGVQLALAIATGIAVLAIAVEVLRKWRDSDSLFLGLWVIGTFIFTAFLNWTVNARSVMPLIPAAAILFARRLETLNLQSRELQRRVALALLLSGAVSLWLTKADSELANSAREAATLIRQQVANQPGSVWFQGHWGFQYYMQQTGARPVDFMKSRMDKGDFLVVPENNADAFRMPLPQFVASTEVVQMQLRQPLSTMRWHVAAGFYSSFYGPLPFAFGPVDTERYYLFRLSMPMARRIVYGRHEGMVNGSIAPNAPGYR